MFLKKKKQDYNKNGLKGYTLYMVIILNMLFHLYSTLLGFKTNLLLLIMKVKY